MSLLGEVDRGPNTGSCTVIDDAWAEEDAYVAPVGSGVRDWLSNLHPIASTVIAINSRMRNLLTSPFNRVLSLQDFIITIGIIDTIGITVNVFMDIFFKFDSCNSLDNLIMR